MGEMGVPQGRSTREHCGQPAADVACAHVGGAVIHGGLHGAGGLGQLGGGALAGQGSGFGTAGETGPDQQRIGQKLLPLQKDFQQLIPGELLHGAQQMCKGVAVAGLPGRGKGFRLRELQAALQQQLRLPQIAAGAGIGRLKTGRFCLRKFSPEPGQGLLPGDGLQPKLGAAAADCGQQLFCVVGQQEENGIRRRLLDELQQGVLRTVGHILGAGDAVNLFFALVGADIGVGLELANQLHRDGFLVRVVNCNDIGVNPREDFTAGSAPAAGNRSSLALQRGG